MLVYRMAIWFTEDFENNDQGRKLQYSGNALPRHYAVRQNPHVDWYKSWIWSVSEEVKGCQFLKSLYVANTRPPNIWYMYEQLRVPLLFHCAFFIYLLICTNECTIFWLKYYTNISLFESNLIRNFLSSLKMTLKGSKHVGASVVL